MKINKSSFNKAHLKITSVKHTHPECTRAIRLLPQTTICTKLIFSGLGQITVWYSVEETFRVAGNFKWLYAHVLHGQCIQHRRLMKFPTKRFIFPNVCRYVCCCICLAVCNIHQMLYKLVPYDVMLRQLWNPKLNVLSHQDISILLAFRVHINDQITSIMNWYCSQHCAENIIGVPLCCKMENNLLTIRCLLTLHCLPYEMEITCWQCYVFLLNIFYPMQWKITCC